MIFASWGPRGRALGGLLGRLGGLLGRLEAIWGRLGGILGHLGGLGGLPAPSWRPWRAPGTRHGRPGPPGSRGGVVAYPCPGGWGGS